MAVTTAIKTKRTPERIPSATIYYILRTGVTGLMNIFYRYRFEGSENVPMRNRLLLAFNHLHLFDSGAIVPPVPRQIIPMAADEYRSHPFFGALLKVTGAVFVHRGEADRNALRASYQILERGGCLAIAPEGKRSKDAAMHPAKPGIALIAARTRTPILPIAHWGIENIRQWRPFKRPLCRVVIGKPFRLPEWRAGMSVDDLQRLADLVMIRVGLMLPERYRGVYAERIAAVEAGQSDELAELVEDV
ncbi:MAG: 1-acyl-sn-glycerol-3-phosphate acyltransferase [Chloroflexi bacterium]|nr:1-acyl-sn-glycerol-3-phosphate acyltransferase [Chloroflexota bacterium]